MGRGRTTEDGNRFSRECRRSIGIRTREPFSNRVSCELGGQVAVLSRKCYTRTGTPSHPWVFISDHFVLLLLQSRRRLMQMGLCLSSSMNRQEPV
jgi:hypothetical protein